MDVLAQEAGIIYRAVAVLLLCDLIALARVRVAAWALVWVALLLHLLIALIAAAAVA